MCCHCREQNWLYLRDVKNLTFTLHHVLIPELKTINECQKPVVTRVCCNSLIYKDFCQDLPFVDTDDKTHKWKNAAQTRKRNRNPEGLITISHYIIKVTNSDKEDIKTSTWNEKWSNMQIRENTQNVDRCICVSRDGKCFLCHKNL